MPEDDLGPLSPAHLAGGSSGDEMKGAAWPPEAAPVLPVFLQPLLLAVAPPE